MEEEIFYLSKITKNDSKINWLPEMVTKRYYYLVFHKKQRNGNNKAGTNKRTHVRIAWEWRNNKRPEKRYEMPEIISNNIGRVRNAIPT